MGSEQQSFVVHKLNVAENGHFKSISQCICYYGKEDCIYFIAFGLVEHTFAIFMLIVCVF